jgi:squalene-associated FAD-dependent desaturase
VQGRLAIPILTPDGRRFMLSRDRLPAPLHLARALMTHRPLSIKQRLSAAVAAAAIGRLDPADPANDAQTLGRWLGAHRQSAHAIENLWDLIALPTLNVPAREASLALGAFVFQEGLLRSADAGDIGLHKAPLSAIIGEPALAALQRAGVEVRLGWRARSVLSAGGAIQVLGAAGAQEESLACDGAIVALPHLRAAELLPPEADEIAQRLRAIELSPIVNLHILYDRRVLDDAFAASVESPAQYLFDRTEAGGAPPDGQYLAVSLSGAEQDMRRSVEQLRERYLPAIEQLLPPARHARVLRFLVSREHAATFKAAPGVGALRPGPHTPLAGLALAGAYTATGWPATLEGAVLSGHAAARAVLSDLGGASAAVGTPDAVLARAR